MAQGRKQSAAATQKLILEAVGKGHHYDTGWRFDYDRSDPDDPETLELCAYFEGKKRDLKEAPSISASLIRNLLFELVPAWPRPMQGVQISGIRITDPLVLAYGRRNGGGALPALICTDCLFTDELYFDHAHFEALDLSRSVLPSLNAELMQVVGVTALPDTVVTKPGRARINLGWIHGGGLLYLSGMSAGPETEEVEVDLLQSKVGGTVSLFALGTRTGRDPAVDLLIYDADIEGELDLGKSRFRRVDAKNVSVRSNLKLAGSTVSGSLDASFASVAGALYADSLTCEEGSSGLLCDGIQINGAWLMKKAVIHGGIKIIGARCEGGWELHGTRVLAPPEGDGKGWAVAARESKFGGSIQMRPFESQPFEARGLVSFRRARIEGDLDLSGAVIAADSEGAETSQDGVVFSSLAAIDATVAGRLYLSAAAANLPASFTGCVTLDRLVLGGDLNVSGSNFQTLGPSVVLISFRDARIGGDLLVRDFSKGRSMEGVVDLTGASVSLLDDDDDAGWGAHPLDETAPGSRGIELRIDGFRYERLRTRAAARSGWPSRRRWLDRQEGSRAARPPYYPQPYDHLVRLFRADGSEREARKAAVYKRIRRRRSGEASILDWLLSVTYQLTFDYGYSPYRAAATLSLYWALGALWLTLADRSGVVVPLAAASTDPALCKDFSPGMRALELMIPLPNLTEASCGISSAAVAWKAAEVGYALLAAILLALAVLTFSGVTRNEAAR